MLKIAWSDIYAHPLPANHRFPMQKYDLLPQQLIYEGTINTSNLFSPGPLEGCYIPNTHTNEYWQKLRNLELSGAEIRKTGLPLSKQLVDRETTNMYGTVTAALFALEHGIAMNIAGGTHHAFSDRGEGFCLLNDIAIGANYLLKKNLVKQILVVDLDVHQGNGTAEIFRNTPEVFTFSMHGAKNYPLVKETSNLDIALPDKTTDHYYLKLLNQTLSSLIEKLSPDFIFFQSGVDVLASDKLGRLALSKNGCKARDRVVINYCKECNIPITITMGGGYSEKISAIIDAHANTFRLAQEIFF